MNESRSLLVIDDRLRFVLFGIQSAVGRWFPGKVIEQIFRDSANDQVSQKSYVLFDSPDLQVFGAVEEHEPESVWITVRSGRLDQGLLDQIVENAGFEVYRIRKT